MQTTEQRPARLTPLWVISLFVSLTEAVTALALTQATDAVQVALTAFVIGFPCLVAAAFFVILWFRPFVLYPPKEFGDSTDVAGYVTAMSSRVERVRSDVEAEAANVRAALALELEAFARRFDTLEEVLANVFRAQSDARELLKRFESAKREQSAISAAERGVFDQNSRYRVHVAAAVPEAKATVGEEKRARELAAALAKLGYRTSWGIWNSDVFLPASPVSRESARIRVIFRDALPELPTRIATQLAELDPNVTVATVPAASMAALTGLQADFFTRGGIDATLLCSIRDATA